MQTITLAPTPVKFTIVKSAPTVTFPSVDAATNVYCGSNLYNIKLTGSAGETGVFLWEYPFTILKTGDYNYNLIFIPSNPNYTTLKQSVSVKVDDLPPAEIYCEICDGYSYSDDVFTEISEEGIHTAEQTLPSGCTREVILHLTVVKNPMLEELDNVYKQIERIKDTLNAIKSQRP